MKKRSKTNILLRVLIALALVNIVCILVLVLINLNKNDSLKSDKVNPTSMTIISKSGIDSLGIASVVDDSSIDLNYMIVKEDEDLEKAFKEETIDLIIAPLDLGMRALNDGSSYRLLAITSFGDVKVLSNGTYGFKAAYYDAGGIDDLLFDELKTNMPDLYRLEEYDSYEEVVEALVNKDVSQAILIEPYVSEAMSEYKELSEDDLGVVYDLNDVYASATGYERYPKTGIFVKSATLSNRQNEVVTILSVMRTNLTTFKTNPSLIKEKAEIFDFGLFGFDDVDLLSEEIDSIANDLTFADSAYDEIVALLEFLEIPFSETYILH